MPAVFISHAVADTKLAKLLVDFLKEAIGVPHDEIFCSSVAGHGVPMTKNFNTYMKRQIQKPNLVLLLMTPSYMESAFCLMELGATWALSHETLPIVVPPVSFAEVTKTLGLVQALDLSKNASSIDLREAVRGTGMVLEKRDEHVWDGKKAEWFKASKRAISKLPGAAKVSVGDHQASLDTIEEQKEEIAGLEILLDEKDDLIEKLKAAKDKAAVAAILKAASGDDDPEEIFDELVGAVTGAMPEVARVVKMHILMDHYGKANSINWYADEQEFQTAAQRNVLNGDDAYAVAWERNKLAALRKALIALDRFLKSEDGRALMHARPAGSPNEADDRDFWEEYL